MRLRQAVLHPTLVLSRLTSNIEANKGKHRTEAEQEGDLDEESIKDLITGYTAANGADAKALLASLGKDDDLEAEGQCMICLDVSRSARQNAGQR